MFDCCISAPSACCPRVLNCFIWRGISSLQLSPIIIIISGHQRGHTAGSECEQLPRPLRAAKFRRSWCSVINRDESRFPHSLQTSLWWSPICWSAGEGVAGQSWDENTLHISTPKGLSWWGTLKLCFGHSVFTGDCVCVCVCVLGGNGVVRERERERDDVSAWVCLCAWTGLIHPLPALPVSPSHSREFF